MAWSTPSSRSAGYVVPHTVWNQDVVDNPVALRGGAIAISGQAAEQLIKASSASQLSYVTVPARGAVLYAGASGAPGWLAAGADGYVLTAAGAGADPAWEAPPGVLDRDVSTATSAGDTNENTVYTYSVAGNTLGTNRMLRVSMIGDILNNSGSTYGCTVKFKYGATTIASFAMTGVVGSNAARNPLHATVELSAHNSTSAQVARGWSWIGQAGVSNAGVAQQVTGAAAFHWVTLHNAVAENSTGALNLVITITNQNADANLSCRCLVVQTELL